MKIARMIVAAWAVMIMATIAIASAPIASASYPIVGKLGSELTMTDTVGQVILSWKVSNLKPSTDVMPDYPVAGKVWEAAAALVSPASTRLISRWLRSATSSPSHGRCPIWPTSSLPPRGPTWKPSHIHR